MQHASISRTRYMQESRKMRFQEAFDGWSQGRLTQAEAALLLSQISRRRASGAEMDHVVQLYKGGFSGWNVAHFHSKYKAEFKGARSYSWLKTVLQGAGVVKISKRRGKHRIKLSWYRPDHC